jgi:hypothetical protein
MEPSRLLDSSHNGLERELLRAARLDEAPEATRARVLLCIGEVLASCSSAVAPCLTLVSSAAPQLSTASESCAATSAAVPSLAARLALAFKSLNALYLGGALAASAAASVLAQHWVSQSPRAEARARAASPALVHARAPVVVEPSWVAPDSASRPSVEPLAPAPHALANTSSEPARAQRVPAPARRGSIAGHARNEGTPHNQLRSELESDTSEDWLGSQLELLGRARAQLELGRLEQAEQVLTGYERRFPGGVVGPQIQRLRAELRTRLQERSSLP